MRRAWGAPPPPKPASERRADGGESQLPPPPAPHQPAPLLHPFLRPPRQHGGRSTGKAPGALPKLGGPASSPRGELPPMKAAWLSQQQGAAAAAATRRKQQAVPAEAQPAGEAAIAALRRPSPAPQLLPSISPEASQRSAAPAWQPAVVSTGLQGGEDDDAVLIGSVAPSFSLPQQPGRSPVQAAPSVATTASPLPAQRRSSLLSSQLGSEDLSLTALAATSRRVTRYTSTASGGSSLPSSQGSRAASGSTEASTAAGRDLPPEADGGDRYAADFEAESPGPGSCVPPLCPAHQPTSQSAQLSSGELALLRQSLLELRLPGGLDSTGADSGAGQTAAAACAQEIPDQVVLRELGARLGRLDSAKRRVLLQVLAKLDAAPDGAAALERRSGSSSSGSQGQANGGSSVTAASVGAPVAPEGQAVSQPSAGSLSSRSRASSRGSAVLPPAKAADRPLGSAAALAPQQTAALPVRHPPGAAAAPAAAGAPPAPQQSPSKTGGLMSRLAALRLGRTSSLGKAGSAAAAAAAAVPQPSPAAALDASQTQHASQPTGSPHGSSLGHSTSAPSLPGLAQQQHRSRLSVDGLPNGRQQGVGPAAAVAALHGGLAAGSGRREAGDALAAFEHQHAGDEAPPALSASPTVMALGGWQQQAEQQAGHASRTRSGSGGAEAAAFAIPACPSGRVLELRISSTWGDPHFVGLTGIELFDSRGQLLTVREPARQVSASPSSINVLPEYGSDPRTPDKLLDGINLTCDCAHMWLAPFTPGTLHTVTVTLDVLATLGALRIWNYSKSRVGALRGARHVEVTLDGAVVFRGEVRQAPGSVAGALQAAELILFTEDAAAQAAIEQHDRQRYLRQLSPPGSGDAASNPAAAVSGPAQLDLVTGGGPASPRGQLARTATLPVLGQPGKQQLGADGRPLTSAQYLPPALPAAGAAAAATAATPHEQRRATASSRGSSAAVSRSTGSGGAAGLLHCRELMLILLDTWGDSHFVGLSGLQVLGADRQPLPLAPAQLAADPPDLNVFPGHKGDIRTVDKLVDGNNCTMDDTSMWLAPMRRQLSASVAAGAQRQRGAGGAALSIDRNALPEAARPYNVLLLRLVPPAGSNGTGSGGGSVAVSGLQIWNYNKSPQDTARGVKRMVVLADGVEVSPPGGVLVRRAPGDAACDFGQLIPLATAWSAAAAAASKARRRSTLQPGGAPVGQQQQQQQLVIHPESLAWACSLPDPAAALDCIQRAALLAKAAGPGGTLVGQPGECFATTLPCGFSLKLVLLSTWGCPHYIGLSGLEVRDAVRGPLHARPDQVWAAPASVAALPGMAADVRTPDKLVDGDCSGAPQHSWLAPLDVQEGNVVRITLDAPVLLSSIRVWNYARTPSRGVQEMEVYLDEQLVWKGVLQRAPAELAPGEDFAQALCFSEEAMQEAAAAARRRGAAATRPAPGRQGGGSGAAAAAAGGGSGAAAAAAGGGTVPGALLGVEGIEEWCEQQERVVLFNNGEFVKPPPECSMPPSARPATALVAA